MFQVCLRRAGDERLYSVATRAGAGWEIRSEENHTLTRYAECRDWHRVERILAMFRREVDALIEQGWRRSPT